MNVKARWFLPAFTRYDEYLPRRTQVYTKVIHFELVTIDKLIIPAKFAGQENVPP